MISRETLLKLPKVDLHCHLDGSLRYESILDIANSQKIDLGAENEDDLKYKLVNGRICKDLNEYLEAFGVTLKVLQTKDNLARAAFELGEDAAKENVKYLEVRFSPILHRENGLDYKQILDSVISGLSAVEKSYDFKFGVIICGMRHIDPKSSLELAKLCVEYKNKRVVGFDLAGAEANHPPKDHLEAYYTALNNNINCTLHAGEAWGPESIHQAIHYCGTHRIGHGTRLKEDLDLMNYVNDHRVPLEVCLKSNLQTSVVKSISEHPAKFYLDQGLRIVICTDNRLVTDTSVTEELSLAVKHLNFEKQDLKNVLISGIKSAFLPHRERTEMVRSFKRSIEEIL